jgi:hypothetical protein
VCRTRWRNLVLCAACVDRALESKEAAPEQAQAHLRQALLSLVLGGVAWILGAIGLVIGIVGQTSESIQVGAILFMMLILLVAALPGSLGLGQAASAVRSRGNHMIMATIGLITNGLFLGVLLGMFSIGLWQQ